MATHLLIKNLLSNKVYEHPTSHLGVIETHVSWIILTGEFAYKIKKPVDFEFLDFSTLAKREYFCRKELQLGQQFAAEIYLGVIPITGSPEHPQINGTGPIIEWAIKMREFPQENLLSNMLRRGGLTEPIIYQLGELIAEFHQKTAAAPANSRFGLPEQVHAPIKQNFQQIAPLLTSPSDIEQLQRLEKWANHQFQQHKALIQKRKKQGFVRDCHGDLHLANIILYKNKPVLFDRLEFNEDLRWTDVMADLAFLLMDLTEKKQKKLANLLLNTYLCYTEDYQGLTLLPYYLMYRAVVRAKIALFRLKQQGLSKQEEHEIQREYYNFIKLAESYTQDAKPCLILMHGFSGSGKTYFAKNLVEHCGAIQLNSDIIRKRLFDIPLAMRTHSSLNKGIYNPRATKRTYKKLYQLAETIITGGFIALVDASFLHYAPRFLFRRLAKKLKIPFYILHCQATDFEIKQRIKKRLTSNDAVSEADLAVLHYQKTTLEPLTRLEKKYTFSIKEKQTSLKFIVETICPKACDTVTV
jgi:uncharacterized protein